MADAKVHDVERTVLVAFESGHYKKIVGKWQGDSVWSAYIKPNGKQVFLNKEKIEYVEIL